MSFDGERSTAWEVDECVVFDPAFYCKTHARTQASNGCNLMKPAHKKTQVAQHTRRPAARAARTRSAMCDLLSAPTSTTAQDGTLVSASCSEVHRPITQSPHKQKGVGTAVGRNCDYNERVQTRVRTECYMWHALMVFASMSMERA